MNRERTEGLNPQNALHGSAFLLRSALLLLVGTLCACVSTVPKGPFKGHGGLFALQPPIVLEADSSPFSEALAWFGRALAFELDEKPAEALEAYQEAVRRDPANITLAMLASQRLVGAGRPQDALELLGTLLERNPDSFAAQVWMARLQLEQGDEARALPHMLRATELEPRHEGPWLEAIRLLVRAKRLPEALELADQGLEKAESPARIARISAQLWVAAMQGESDPARRQTLGKEVAARLEALRERFPRDESVVYLLAALRMEAGAPQAVFPLLRALDRAHGPDSEVRPQILLQLSRFFLGPGGVMAEVGRILEQEPGDVLALHLSGMMQEVAGRPDLALSFYQEAVEADPGDLPSWRKLAVLYYQDNQPRRAVRSLETVLAQLPDDLELLRLAGHLQLAIGNPQEAARQFQGIELQLRQGAEIEDPASVHAGLAMAQLVLGNGKGALDALYLLGLSDPAALEIPWRWQVSHAYDAGVDLEERDRRQRFLLEVLLDLSDRLPDSPAVEYLIARTHALRLEHAEAVSALERMAEIAGELENAAQWLDTEYYFDLAAALERLGRIEESYAAFERSLALDPENAQSLNYLAYMWAERGVNLDQALVHAERALKVDPQNGSYLDTLGWVLYQKGDFVGAYQALDRAAECEPGESLIVEHLADAAVALGRPVEAVGLYRIALELGAGDREDLLRESLRKAEDAVAEAERRTPSGP